ncbi:MAG: DUF2182 domain-containing protein [Rhizomicrobium sp.]
MNAVPPVPLLLLLTSALAWTALWRGASAALAMPSLCGTASDLAAAWAAAQLALALHPPLQIALSWLVLLLAMTLPLAAGPAEQLWRRTRHGLALGLFLCSYLAIWLAAGAVLVPLALVIGVAAAALGVPALGLVAALALLWQVMPPKRAALRLSLQAPPHASRSRPMPVVALRFGARAGAGCVGSGWALMLAPLVLNGGSRLVMIAVAALLLMERRAVAGAFAHWRWQRSAGAAPDRRVRVATSADTKHGRADDGIASRSEVQVEARSCGRQLRLPCPATPFHFEVR